MKNKIGAAGLPKIAPSNMAFCQPIIPLAFDNSLSYYEFIAKINGKLNETICVVNRQNGFLFDFQKAVDVKLNAFNTELVNFKTEWADYQTEINGIVTTINYKATEALDTANAAAETATAAQASATGAANAATNAATAAEAAAATAQEAATTAATYGGRISALENQHVGRISPTGETVTIDGTTYTYGNGAEYFNEYEGATKNNAVGDNSHASGGSSNAIGDYSFAHGGATNADGDYSTAFGRENYADGDNSFVAGKMNFASGNNSAVFGIGNTASAAGGFVCGEYADTDNNTAFAVGNGTSSAAGNAFEVDKSGNLYAAGNAKALNETVDENRAALVELVDGGAKNFIKVGFTSKPASSTNPAITNNNDGSITINGSRAASTPAILVYDMTSNLANSTDTRYTLPAGKYVVNGTGNVNAKIQVYMHDGTNLVSLANAGSGTIEFEYTVANKILYPYICWRININGESSFDNFTFNPMICTKAAWDISHAFQPYRLSYDEICRRLEYFVTALTESEYTALSTKNNNTLYAVLPDNAQRALNLAPSENNEEREEAEETERR